MSAHQGWWFRKRVMIDWHKLQAVELTRNRFQARRNVAHVTFHTSSGIAQLPHLHIDVARELRDLALAQVIAHQGTLDVMASLHWSAPYLARHETHCGILLAFVGMSSALAQIDDEFWFVAPEVTSLHEDGLCGWPPSMPQRLSFPCLPMLVFPFQLSIPAGEADD